MPLNLQKLFILAVLIELDYGRIVIGEVEPPDHLPDPSLIHPVRKKHIGGLIDYPPALPLLHGRNYRLPFGTDFQIRRRRDHRNRKAMGRAIGKGLAL
ncbi:hypothetical protein V3C99_014863 [Haemonchus contortus]